MEFLQGRVDSLLFQNEENGYSVIKVRTSRTSEEIIAVGNLHAVRKGLTASFSGNWERHAVYGKQFHVEHYEILQPSSKEGIITFLSSGILPGIGKAKALRIVEKFGLTTLDIIDNNPEKLLDVAGIGKKLCSKIIEEWKKNTLVRDIASFFKEYDISLLMIKKIVQHYGEDTKKKVCENPYILADEMKGIGFIKADTIASKMGFAKNSDLRIRSGLLYVMKKASDEGHCCLPCEELVGKTVAVLLLPREAIELELQRALQKQVLIEDNNYMFLPFLHRIENALSANMISRYHNKVFPITTEENIVQWISESEKASGRSYNKEQRKVIWALNSNQLILLTGGPGTGKTTVLKLVADFCQANTIKVLLAAPTGRAAQKISESTGLTAKTIHRLLEYRPCLDKGFVFGVNEEHPLDADLVVIDETSMLDVILLYHLCKGIRTGTKILFVGDDNQLPSIGPGAVLSDMIASGIFVHIHLDIIFRQAEKSRIVSAAHQINHGIIPECANKKDDDLFFIATDDPSQVLETVISLVTRRLPEKYNLNPLQHIQVLSPMHKGILGTENINKSIQNVLKKSIKNITLGDTVFFCGDKVIQTKNNYESGIFNGEIGIITDITEDDTVTIDFNGTPATYPKSSLDQISLGYCISIHKSQGSEFDMVVIPIMMHHYVMLQRTLLYTALTRAKSLCVLVGQKKAFSYATRTFSHTTRYSLLAEKMKI